MPRPVQTVTRARLAGGLATLIGVALLAYREYASGLSVLVAGVAILLLVTEKGVSDELPAAATRGTQAALASLVQGLHLQGRGVHLPMPNGTVRLFVPPEDIPLDELRVPDPDIVLQRETAGTMGALLTPTGDSLVQRWKATNGLPDGRGAEQATQHIRAALTQFGLGAEIVVARSERALRITYRPIALADACRDAREAQAPWHLQGGCPACSLVCALVAFAHAAPARTRAAGADEGHVWLELEVGVRSTA